MHEDRYYSVHKSRVVAGLFALFLGPFGMHKFYLGYANAGFIMLGVSIVGGLSTCGLAALVMYAIGLVEGIFYLMHTQEEFEQIYVHGCKEWF